MNYRILLTMISLCFYIGPTNASDAEVSQLLSGVIKGSVTDYFPNIFKNNELITMHAIVHNPWSGKLYLRNNDPEKNMAKATFEFYSRAEENIKEFSKGFCQGYLGNKSIKTGYFFVDQFDVSQIYEDGIAHYYVSGNVMCFRK